MKAVNGGAKLIDCELAHIISLEKWKIEGVRVALSSKTTDWFDVESFYDKNLPPTNNVRYLAYPNLHR